jgi:hypothetical protein
MYHNNVRGSYVQSTVFNQVFHPVCNVAHDISCNTYSASLTTDQAKLPHSCASALLSMIHEFAFVSSRILGVLSGSTKISSETVQLQRHIH